MDTHPLDSPGIEEAPNLVSPFPTLFNVNPKTNE